MQLRAGRPADQWRGAVIDDAGNTAESATRRDSAGDSSAGRHQHRPVHDRGTDSEYVGLCRKHDDEPGNAGHDGTGQRHGRRGNAGRIACIAIRLLTGETSLPHAFARRLVVRPKAASRRPGQGHHSRPCSAAGDIAEL